MAEEDDLARKRPRISPSRQLHRCEPHHGRSLAEEQEPNPGLHIDGAFDKMVAICDDLVAALSALTFPAPVACVYNPLVYARAQYLQYVSKHGGRRVEVLLVGMNPGPFGMAQTGIPFGDCVVAREFLGISGTVQKPKVVHPKRPIHGLDCSRREVSGQRLWGWAQKRFGSAAAFFSRFWVYNFCPLAFMEASGRNLTPDKLRMKERTELEATCRAALVRVIELLKPRLVVGVGKYARQQISLCGVEGVEVGQIMHPSPANPKANKWDEVVEVEFDLMKVHIPKD